MPCRLLDYVCPRAAPESPLCPAVMGDKDGQPAPPIPQGFALASSQYTSAPDRRVHGWSEIAIYAFPHLVTPILSPPQLCLIIHHISSRYLLPQGLDNILNLRSWVYRGRSPLVVPEIPRIGSLINAVAHLTPSLPACRFFPHRFSNFLPGLYIQPFSSLFGAISA